MSVSPTTIKQILEIQSKQEDAPQSRGASFVYMSSFDKFKQFVLLNRIEILKAVILAYSYTNLIRIHDIEHG